MAKTSNIKRINIKEFRKKGFLQEANRLFFHPLGLALEVIINDKTGEESLGGIWDFRDDPEGLFFQKGKIDLKKIDYVNSLRESKRATRIKNTGEEIQSK